MCLHVCVCVRLGASIAPFVKRHNSTSQDHIMETTSDICDRLITLQLTLKLSSSSLTFPGNKLSAKSFNSNIFTITAGSVFGYCIPLGKVVVAVVFTVCIDYYLINVVAL